MQAGKLRHRVTLQSPVTASNPFETDTQGSWTDVVTMWADIESAGPRDIYNAGLQNMQVSHIVTIRYPGVHYSIGAGYQILFGTRVFQILKGIINEAERNRMLQLYAWEVNPTQ